jgi:hypothetical protein
VQAQPALLCYLRASEPSGATQTRTELYASWQVIYHYGKRLIQLSIGNPHLPRTIGSGMLSWWFQLEVGECLSWNT